MLPPGLAAQVGTLLWGVAYVASSTAEVATIKGLNNEAGVYLATFSALALNQLWLLMLPGYLRALWTRRRARRAAGAAAAAAAAAASKAQHGYDASNGGDAAVAPHSDLLDVDRGGGGGGGSGTATPLGVVVTATHARTLSASAAAAAAALRPAAASAGSDGAASAHANDATARSQRPPRPQPSRPQLAAAYALFSLVTYGITLLRNVSANAIPGGVFSLLVSTSIVFNIGLSRLVLRRALNAWHLLAAGLCLAAAVVLGVFGTREDVHTGGAGHEYAIGVPAALGAAFCIAASSVLNDKVTRDWPDKDFRIVEMTVVASVGASLLLVPTLFALGEQRQWGPQLGAAWAAPRSRAFLVALTAAMPFVKAGSRVSKYQTISHSSALFFEFVQAAAALVSAVANVLLFGEQWDVAFVGAGLLIVAAFACYTRARAVMKRAHRADHVHGIHHHAGHAPAPSGGDDAVAAAQAAIAAAARGEPHPLELGYHRIVSAEYEGGGSGHDDGGGAGGGGGDSGGGDGGRRDQTIVVAVSMDDLQGALAEAGRRGWLPLPAPPGEPGDAPAARVGQEGRDIAKAS